ncbi:hypothetical protein JMJ58_03705 [Haloterrigena salifodinae]|uniref:Uncharacterized protein n=1 Tax=Haloterrigena salifodinae TaxID=2675099 RepID=A0A8T8E2C8_9EURY|nr:hypothetical protein [Haloterrigena salifodinae]QRV16014.1 hypothetical protein JMJ58_03705 [Haloterrigena salifodinae]
MTEDIVCPYCQNEVEEIEHSSQADQYSHHGHRNIVYGCSECGYRLEQTYTGVMRSNSSSQQLQKQEEVVPEGYLVIVHTGTQEIVNTVSHTDEEIRRAIDACQTQDTPWDIFTGGFSFEMRENKMMDYGEREPYFRIDPEKEYDI